MFFPFQFPAWLLASPSTLRSPYYRPLAGVIHTLAYQSLPTSIPCGKAIARRRTEDRRVGLASGGTVERWRRFSSRGRVALPSSETRQQIPTQLATGPLNFSPATKLSDSAFPRCTYPVSSPAHPTANPLRAR